MRDLQALSNLARGDAAEKEVLLRRKAENVEAEFRRIHKAAGEIPALSPLLDARRIENAIPNGAFKIQAAFDVCLVHQLPRFTGETFGDTQIIMPETSKKRVEEETPRGVLVSAGLRALDCLRSNGIDLGHIVSFIRQAPWRMPIENVAGADFHLLILRAGDITGSEDLRVAIERGECSLQWDEEAGQHFYIDAKGKRWNPTLPFIPEDY